VGETYVCKPEAVLNKVLALFLSCATEATGKVYNARVYVGLMIVEVAKACGIPNKRSKVLLV
jgi:hypothetical protein